MPLRQLAVGGVAAGPQICASVAPLATPHPHALRNTPQGLNSMIRALMLSTTKTFPVVGSVTTPLGPSVSPALSPHSRFLSSSRSPQFSPLFQSSEGAAALA